MKVKDITDIVLTGIIIIFVLSLLWNGVSAVFGWLGETFSPGRNIANTERRTEKPAGPNTVKAVSLHVIAYPNKWGKELTMVKPGYDMTIQTVPKGQSVEVMLRDDQGNAYDQFSLGDKSRIEKPTKPLTPGEKFFLDFWSNEPGPVEMIIYYFPLQKNKLISY